MITELRLKDFKCLKEDAFSLSRVNVFAGRNGIGKSSLMQSMLLIAQSMEENGQLKKVKMNGKFLQLGTFHDILRQNGGTDEVVIRIVSDDSSVGDFAELILGEDKEPGSARIVDLKTPQVDSALDTPSANSDGTSGNNSKNALASVDVTSALPPLMQLQNVYFISADRTGPMNSQKKDPSITLNNVGIHGEHIINVLYRGGSSLMADVHQALSYVMKQSTLEMKEVNDDLLLLLDSVDNSQGFKPVNVGFGYSYVLTILLTLLVAEPKSKVFIENPEAHLHPGAQSRLVDFLFRQTSRKKLQLFIETHSENIFNAVRRASLSDMGVLPQEVKTYFFYDDEEKALHYTEIELGDDGSLNRFPVDFFDQTRQELREMMLLVKSKEKR